MGRAYHLTISTPFNEKLAGCAYRIEAGVRFLFVEAPIYKDFHIPSLYHQAAGGRHRRQGRHRF